MTQTEPTLAAPLRPSTVDFGAILAAHAERTARILALRPGNKDRLFDGLLAAGITHVTVTFDGAGDSGQIESIGAWSGETAVDFPATEIEYAALTWDDPEVEMRQLSLEDVVEQLTYDFLSDTMAVGKITTARGASSASTRPPAASISSSTSASPRPNFTRMISEGAAMAHPYHHALSSVKKWGGTVEDTLEVHAWLDQSKEITADFRHRALRHHAEGIFMAETIFGPTLTLSTGRIIPTRWVGEQHVKEDLGFIPSFADWVKAIRPEPWMGRTEQIEALVDPHRVSPVVELS
jgi:hypothetical protein